MFFCSLMINSISGEQHEMVLAVLHGIAVNFRDQKICRLKPWKCGNMPEFFIYHFVSFKGCKIASHVPTKWKLVLLISSSRSFVQSI